MAASFHYQAYYCEENAWHMAQTLQANDASTTASGYVALISNPTKSCALWYQKAAPSPTDAIVWDYHVVVIWPHGASDSPKGTWHVWDLDTLLGMPVPTPHYFTQTFSGWAQWPETFRPVFRIIPAQEYIEILSSDRSHMRRDDGSYIQPPPPWEAPYRKDVGNNLMQLADMNDTHGPGQLHTMATMPHQEWW